MTLVSLFKGVAQLNFMVYRVFQIALRGGRGGGTKNFAGGGNFFLLGGGGICTRNFFRSFEAFVMLKLIFHIYWTSVNENWHQTLI